MLMKAQNNLKKSLRIIIILMNKTMKVTWRIMIRIKITKRISIPKMILISSLMSNMPTPRSLLMMVS
jgi:hypothetical protein